MTSWRNDQRIAHLAYKAGGKPFCGSRRAQFSVTVANRGNWAICKRCEARLAKMQARNQRTADAFNEAGVFAPFTCVGGPK
jgi:hypothetical protein